MRPTLLVAGKDAGPAVGLTCRTGNIGNDPALLYALGGIASRIASIMNVATLLPVTTTDYFQFDESPPIPRTTDRRLAYGLGRTPYTTQRLRLSNGLIDPASLVITGPYGDTVVPFSNANFVNYEYIDARLGVIEVDSPWDAGQWSVTYDSGLPVYVDPDNPTPGPDEPVILDTSSEPWMPTALGILLRLYNITAGGQKIQEGLRFDAVDVSIRTELAATIYQAYERPRYGVLWPRFSKQVS